ncbi:MAG TPA: carbohydrate ABC transporter permease [Clostridia bacterium]|jgi:raffinose/stachyose/melibiose transport system permease protein|nr:carbohydrate ABC transporter permease [Clostridia bacterium]
MKTKRLLTRSRDKKKSVAFWIAVSILCLLALISLFPLALVVLNSFKTHTEIMLNPFSWPTSFSFHNYVYTWEIGKFGSGFINSIKLTASAIIAGVIGSSTMGYVLATRRVKTWRPLTLYFMLATTVPLQMFMLPLYSTFVDLKLMGNVYAVGVAIAAWNLPMPIFLMRTYFLKVPFELEEAARIDGANTFHVLTKVIMPIVSPGIITVACIIGLFSWNEYLLTTTLLKNEVNFTATLKFLNLNGTFSRDFSVIMAGAVIMVIPMVLVFLLLQKRFIEGMANGAVKG